MSFVSTHFVLFAAAFYLLFFLTPLRWRAAVLLAGSYAFCAFFGIKTLIVLGVSTITNFLFCRAMGQAPDRAGALCRLAVLFNILWLGSFKYLDFLAETLWTGGRIAGWTVDYAPLGFLFPIGISFYTFQAITLVVDVRRGRVAPPRLFDVALFLAFWPKLIAGPIERFPRFTGQVAGGLRFRWANLWLALELGVYGLALKTMLGDFLAPEVNKVYGSPLSYSPADNLVAMLLYTFQIYGDFAGYTLMTMGAARLMGVRIGPNFRRPNFARSFTDFWNRWHISLSSFLNEYIYRNLPYRRSEGVIARNQIVTMLVSGLWHGPAWTFVAWGGLHGLFLVLQRQVTRLTRPLYDAVPSLGRWTLLPQIGCVFAMVAISRVFFRADSIGQALSIFGHIIDGPIDVAKVQSKAAIGVCFLIIAGVSAAEWLVEIGWWKRARRLRILRVGWAVALFLLILVIGEFEGGQFVYVRF